MISIINSSNIMGVDSFDVSVETDISNGIPSFNIVGLPGTEIKEARERVKSAIINSGYIFPNSRIVVNLSPADIKKQGAFLDLPISIGILRGKITSDRKNIEESIFVGELSLNGDIKEIKGVLPIVIGSRDRGYKRIFIPYNNYSECSFIKGIDIIPVKSLKKCIAILNGGISENEIEILKEESLSMNIKSVENIKYDDFVDIKGNIFLRRCAEISAAGGHHMLMIGPPGSGKSFVAKRIPGILPNMDDDEALEVNKIYSVYGNKKDINKRPFRSPHHTVTEKSLIGGGSDARAGEITLAHKGILFLDEIPEFDRRTLEALRQPIEDKKVNISRIRNSISYPSDFLMISAMNPCPCGYFGSEKECRCKRYEIDRYLGKLSGPLLDRIDIFVEVESMGFEDISSSESGESSEAIKYRVQRAREIQRKRFKEHNGKTNRDINISDINRYCNLDDKCKKVLEIIFKKYRLSNRSYTRLVSVARTIADLSDRKDINEDDILEAFSMRKVYYKYFERNKLEF